MIFNSIDFAIFLPLVFIGYWFLFNQNLKLQNFYLIVVSYLFYGWWDYRFLFLIFFSTVVDYAIGIRLEKNYSKRNRRLLLCSSLVINLGLLFFFKYCNFFIENFNDAFSILGFKFKIESLNVILPVGISFYTFQTLSYSIDVYRRKINATKDFTAFMAFISFFPQLVAGPIERASNLLPQFFVKRKFDYSSAVNGLRQILWGLFKKIVIADNCAEFANITFDNPEQFGGSTLLLGAIFFSFQIYCDFSGYSDIAIGTARLFGFDLMKNFSYPYFARDIAEFWRKWHISLSTWFRDYIYIPLGGNQGNVATKIRNTLIIFLLSGFWHGANWTFIAWGALNAIYFIPSLLLKKNRLNMNIVAEESFFPTMKEICQMTITFLMVVISWILFRSDNIEIACKYYSNLISMSIFSIPEGRSFIGANLTPLTMIVLLTCFVLFEFLGRKHPYALAQLDLFPTKLIRYSIYYLIIVAIFLFGGREQTFIYFQF